MEKEVFKMEINVYVLKHCADCLFERDAFSDEPNCPYFKLPVSRLRPVFVDDHNIKLLCPYYCEFGT